MVGCSRGWRISSASVCSAVTTSSTSATGAAGIPASVKSRCHSAVSRSSQPVGEDRDQLLAVRHAIGIRAEPRIGQELGEVERGAERGEQPIVPAGDHQLAVAGGEDLIRRDHREDRSLRHRHRPVGEEPDEVVADVGERGLVERGVDHGTFAVSLALEECRDDPERGPHARAHVDQRRADANTRTPRLPRHADEAARSLHECVVARLARERPDVAVGADRAVDESRVPGAHRRRAQAEPLREPRSEALEEDVGVLGELHEHLAAALVTE